MIKKWFVIILSCSILLSGGLIAKPTAAYACSCAAPSSTEQQVKDELERKSAIFAGTVTEVIKPSGLKIMSSADLVQVSFEVSTVWKGEVARQASVYTAMSSAGCGYENFTVGKAYLVSAYNNPTKLETGVCELTKPLSSATEELAVLGDGYLPSPISAKVQLSGNQASTEAQAAANAPSDLIFAAALVLMGSAIALILIKRRKYKP
ncbi:hypothetical protein [Paenibacillus sp. sgz302251]|uniref:hypothetical protein n=1 Tax=Paenibacillus sp. sgz302251 TaxID=3414493 RepID=UPI003C7E82E2